MRGGVLHGTGGCVVAWCLLRHGGGAFMAVISRLMAFGGPFVLAVHAPEKKKASQLSLVRTPRVVLEVNELLKLP